MVKDNLGDAKKQNKTKTKTNANLSLGDLQNGAEGSFYKMSNKEQGSNK